MRSEVMRRRQGLGNPLFGLMGVVLALASWSLRTEAAEGKIVIKLGHSTPATSVHHQGLLRFAELVARRTENRIEVQVFPASQLGDEKALLEAQRAGGVQMSTSNAGTAAVFDPQLQLLVAPYTWKDMTRGVGVLRGPIGQEIAKGFLAKTGIRILDMGSYLGVRHLITRDKAITKPADLRGVKIRAPQAPIYLETFKAMGANPVGITIAEVYSALQTRIVEGAENQLDSIFGWKWYEVAKFVNLTQHMVDWHIFTVSEKFFQSLSPADRKVIEEAAIEADDYKNKLVVDREREMSEKMRAAGVTFVASDVEAFRASVQPIFKTFDAQWGAGLRERVLTAQ
ncbi:MAG: hypothetical protein A3G80_15300 [Betaproteobacteria bacterium RIFCSPLOWO2_12_FULL_62_13b]|nr:MAG: hypothetical protein A3G80_15300 [Betaproteobacteria bacterium RIFCSPLOWO2_12_FULL_62_13b]